MRRLLIVIAALTMLASSGHKDAYIVSVGDGVTFNTGTSLDEFLALRKRVSCKCIWVRRAGHEYIIRDETTVLRAEALFAPEAAFGPQQAAISREEAQLDREADRLEDMETRTAAQDRRLEELHARLRVVAQREKEIDDKQEELERAAERAFWPLVDTAIRAGLAKPLTR